MAEETGKAKAVSSDAQGAPAVAESNTLKPSNDSATAPSLERRSSSSQQPLRHGRKPIYPDSDAEAEGLDADVDDEELETGLPPGPGDHERSSLLGGSARNGQSNIGPLDRAWLNVSKLWGGDKAYAARLVRRRKQRRNAAAASSTSRRNSRSIHTSSAASFSAWRHEHPFIMRTLYAIVALLFILLVLIAVAVSHLYLATLKSPTPEAQSRILDESLLLKGPDRVQLLNISDEGILVRVDARLGLDPDHALDLWLGHRGKQGWWRNKERKLVEWTMGKVAGVQVDVGQVRLSEIGAVWDQQALPSAGLASAGFDPRDLLAFHLDPLVLPLPPLNRKIEKGKDDEEALRPPILGNHSTPAAQHNMSPLNLTVLLKPVVPAPYIMDYAQHAIKKGFAHLDVKIESLRVRGLAKSEIDGIHHGRKAGFFDVPRRIDIAQQHIRSPVREKVPKLDNDTNPDDLLKVDGYEFFEAGQDDGDDDKHDGKDDFVSSMVMRALGLRAKAQAMNPLGKMLQGNVRYSLPFGIFLPVDAAPARKPPKHPKDGKSHAMDDEEEASDAAVLMAAVATQPFQLTGQKVVEVDILGRVVPPPQEEGVRAIGSSHAGQTAFKADSDSVAAEYTSEQDAVHSSAFGDTPQQAALSNFLSKFLRGENNTVYVRGGSPFREPKSSKSSNQSESSDLPGEGSDLPEWMDSALRLVDLPISFPGAEVTELIKNVTINDLKISPHPFDHDKLLCSGTVMGEMNMPGELSSIDVQITHMWPDILVYDGLPPDMRKSVEVAGRPVSRFNMLDGALDSLKRLAFLHDSADDAQLVSALKDDPKKPEPVPPLPDPLPEKAFGRVRPYDFSPAETFTDPADPEGKRKLLRAVLKDVPFTVLPGRGPLFRSFTWKLVTGQGALVGIQGTSRAKIWNSGLGALQLRNLPVKGAFMLGKRD
ncbi:hypothetical protein PSEUBRA_000582 [Kalmanozyma brasiliensis GHG001]|uniref:Uncharacterized protein n=1 Tax=Kalmanozyma brasiliensis (strain GHG001) TaxID=1365824 RepID=V5F3P5_KALBG|nr:uncharacterized protein PSEUBRA_000582 [Kalmanozyma brasiliensis GHG001]EST10169.1 hypothetical protein PSEUBRA_000582 [Kalmanozyma brasiliensis GHG001]